MTFTLMDRTGDTVRDAANLAGRRIRLTYTSPSGGMSPVFYGIITSGLRVRRDPGGAWRITLSASSTMILWKRLRGKGPVSTSSQYDNVLRDNFHWLGTSSDLLTEMNKRARAIDGPECVPPGGMTNFNPQGAAPYPNSEFPSQLTVLHEYGETGKVTLWYEDATYISSRPTLTAIELTSDQYAVSIDTECRTIVSKGGDNRASQRLATPASQVESDATYQLYEPYTTLTFQLLSTSLDTSGKPSFNDAQLSFSVDDVPDDLKTVQKSIIIPTRHFKDPVYTFWSSFTSMFDSTRERLCRQLLRNLCLRFTPVNATFDSDKLDTDQLRYYMPQPIRYIAFSGQPTDLPFDAIGPYAAIGGTLTIDWKHGSPHARNEVTLWPLPCDSCKRGTWRWADLPAGWTATYATGNIQYDQLTQTDEYLTYKAAA